MIGRRSLIRSCLPVFVWMAVIFVGSTDVLSARQTSRFIGPLLRWFNPDISVEMIKRVQSYVRKSGHLAEYAILAMLCWRAGSVVPPDDVTGWDWKRAARALAVAIVYAISDEVHQSFWESRMGNPWDVLIDAAGALAGLILIWTWGRWRDYW